MTCTNCPSYAHIIQYLNVAGIGLLLIFSIYMRRLIIKVNFKLDEEHITPSDFTIIVRDLPLKLTRQELKN
jgi:hypothetical protein